MTIAVDVADFEEQQDSSEGEDFLDPDPDDTFPDELFREDPVNPVTYSLLKWVYKFGSETTLSQLLLLIIMLLILIHV